MHGPFIAWSSGVDEITGPGRVGGCHVLAGVPVLKDLFIFSLIDSTDMVEVALDELAINGRAADLGDGDVGGHASGKLESKDSRWFSGEEGVVPGHIAGQWNRAAIPYSRGVLNSHWVIVVLRREVWKEASDLPIVL